MAKKTAVIDIGSNSITLIIYQKTSRYAFSSIHTAKFKVKIGEGSYTNNSLLTEDAMERAFEVLYDFAQSIKAYKCQKTLCIATSALRDAPNKKVFIKRVDNNLGIKIKVINGDKEAKLGAIAALNLLPRRGEFTTIDIGGGSTELVKVKDYKVVKTISLQLGHVRLKEIENRDCYIASEIKKLGSDFSSEVIVGIGGTARSISKYIQNQNPYPLQLLHGFSYRNLKDIDKLLFMDDKTLLKNAISKDRVATIKEGTIVFSELLEHLGAKKVITSESGIREGLYLSDLLRNTKEVFPHKYDMSLVSILDRVATLPKLSAYRANVALKLYDVISSDSNYKQELSLASKLMNLSYSISELSFGHTHKTISTVHFLLKSLSHIDKKKFEKYSLLLPSYEVFKQLVFVLKVTKLLTNNALTQKVEVKKVDESIEINIDFISKLTIQKIKDLDKNIKVIDARKSI